jgi:hypothetical protein
MTVILNIGKPCYIKDLFNFDGTDKLFIGNFLGFKYCRHCSNISVLSFISCQKFEELFYCHSLSFFIIKKLELIKIICNLIFKRNWKLMFYGRKKWYM